MPEGPPTTADELRSEIVRRYEGLSKRLQQIARYILDQPNDVALDTLAVIAARCGVQPSTIVRFAKGFGFDGATQMQRLFRDGLFSTSAALGYSERLRQLDETIIADGAKPADLLAEFVESNQLALEHLLETVSAADMRAAVDLIDKADTVFVMGLRRSFPVASYLAYSLLQTGKRVVFIDGIAGLAQAQVEGMTRRDLLIAVSYEPYAEETVAIVEAARARHGKVLAISDSPVSPVAKPADTVLLVHETEVRTFRSLSASMCLAQALVINCAFAASGNRPRTSRKRASAAA